MPAAVFVVRATVSDPAKREAFGTWYSREHLPDAMKSFGAVKAWRYWSATEPSLTTQCTNSRTKPRWSARSRGQR
jgi:hypothetical protein